MFFNLVKNCDDSDITKSSTVGCMLVETFNSLGSCYPIYLGSCYHHGWKLI